MSLLMEALRKAEQAKKQAAGSPPAPVVTPVESPVPQGEQQGHESLLVLEKDEGEAMVVDLSEAGMSDHVELSQAGQGEDEKSRPGYAGAGGPEHGLALNGRGVDVALADTPASADLDKNSGRESGMGSVAEESVELSVADLSSSSATGVQAGPIVEAARERNDASAIGSVMAAKDVSRQAARTVFTAKKEYQRRSRNRRLLVLGIVGGIALLGMATFLFFTWRAMMISNVPVVVAEENITPQGSGGGVEPEALPQPEGSKEPLSKGAELFSPAQQEKSLSGAPPLFSESAAVAASAPLSAQMSQELPASFQDASATDLLPDAVSEPVPPSPAPIVITHRSALPQMSSRLSAAYGAYQKGDFKEARQAYQQVLQADPKNHGALLGLAAIAMQGHENFLARDLYLRLLDQDPSDPLARAGLLAIAPTGDPVQQESELKLLLDIHPDSAPLFFSLGNLYAVGQRWNEAQQAYFNALLAAKNVACAGRSSSIPGAIDTGPSLACVHPDYPFNLAVSLEHLGQLKAAAGYYREALQLAADRSAGFDPEGLRARLKILEQEEMP